MLYADKKIIIRSLKLLSKKIGKKLKKKIYYINRKISVKRKPINLENIFFISFRSNCSFLYNIIQKEQYVLELNKLSAAELIIISADKTCNHVFNLLGSDDRYLGGKLPWNKDFKTEFKWDNKFYKSIKTVNLYNNADVKVPWELSRFQHLFTIGKAYWITNNEKYAVEFKEEVEDWSEKNPIEMSVNWTCTMDVAIRAINLICSYFFFVKSKNICYEFWIKFNKLLYLHGRFIYKNLENEAKYNGNHYLSDLAGLIWLGIYFGDFSVQDNEKRNNSKDWLKFGLVEFEKEMKNEINEDGTDYEASTAYHRLVAEIFLITTKLCNINDINFSKDYMRKLEKMCEFIADVTKPNGLSPIIGDGDDGRLLMLSYYSSWNKMDFRHILAIAGEYFNRDDFRFLGKTYKEDALWMIGSYKCINKETQQKSKAYSDGGYYILRSNRIYCIIRCGELSCRGEGGHSHNDQLSVEINIDGEDFIVDPGTYVYTSDYKRRNLFRSTKMHNTLCIDKLEQNYFNDYDLFYMREQSFGKCKFFNCTTFLGEHYGYKEKCGVIHERKIDLETTGFNIRDKLIGNVINYKSYINFILDHGVEVKEKDNGIELIKNSIRVFVKFDNPYLIEEAYFSQAYGKMIRTKRVLINLNNENAKVSFRILDK